MKAIKSIHQLQAEKKRVQLHQQNVENKIHNSWAELKNNIKLFNLGKDIENEFALDKHNNDTKKESILKSTFAYGVSLLARKFVEKASKKITTLFKK